MSFGEALDFVKEFDCKCIPYECASGMDSVRPVSYTHLDVYKRQVHPTAAAGRDMIQAETFLAKDFSLKQETDDGKPQILIYHSHSQEEFAD